MVDVTMTIVSPAAFQADVAGWGGHRNPVRNGKVHPTGWWKDGADRYDLVGDPYRYVTTPPVTDAEGNVRTPAVLHPKLHQNVRMSLEAFEDMLDRTNPVGIMPGGTRVIGATGLPFDPDDPDPKYPNGVYGNPPVAQRIVF